MGRFSEKIAANSLIGIDTALFIYHFEEHPSYIVMTRELFSGIELAQWNGITSTITLMEIIVRPLALGRGDVARKYEALLLNFPNLEVVNLDLDVIRRAAQIRAEYRLRPPDALQAGASLVHGADLFITNDRSFERLRGKLEVVILQDFI